MEQNLLNKIAWQEIKRQSGELFVGLTLRLDGDHRDRQKEMISEKMIRCVQNVVLFDCIRVINSPTETSNSTINTPKQYMEYMRFAETLRPKIFEVAEALKGFQPVE